MSFDWVEYLDLAQELAGHAPIFTSQEAKSRAAISRAYYAAFCKSRNHLRDADHRPVPRSAQAHTYVRKEFDQSADKVRKGLAKNLERLRIKRNAADCDDAVVNLPSETTFALTLAQKVISDLSTL